MNNNFAYLCLSIKFLDTTNIFRPMFLVLIYIYSHVHTTLWMHHLDAD